MTTGLEKVSFHFSPKKDNVEECSSYHTIALISCASKIILKILQDRLEKVSFHSSPKKDNVEECSNYHTIALISCASKIILKILQDRLQ